jgi:adenine-specific DNA-methyltransferase
MDWNRKSDLMQLPIIIPRLKKVISGNDKGGISENYNYVGGGSFKFYNLGPSIISFDNLGNGRFQLEFR